MVRSREQSSLSSPKQPGNLRLSEIEGRLTALGIEIEKVSASHRASPRWWREHAGRFENDPIFDEILELGRKYRAGERAKKR